MGILLLVTLFWCVVLISPFSSSHQPKKNEDWIKTHRPRIKGGEDAEKGAYPWQAAIHVRVPGYEGVRGHHCGASIINNQWIVTAAHCFKLLKYPSNFTVIVGEYDYSFQEGTEQHYDVQRIIVNEDYQTPKNDIALLQITDEFQFDEYVSPIDLAAPEQDDFIEGNTHMYCITTGWGDLAKNGSKPDILQALKMPLLPIQTCVDIFGKLETVTDDMLCTGYIDGKKSPCNGDSGGPLACMLQGKWTLVGLTSHGKECGVEGYPGIFTRVAYFYNWIMKKMENT